MTDKTLKMDRTDYTCETCYRSFHKKKGLERHKDNEVCV